jgi:hypothetical protein
MINPVYYSEFSYNNYSTIPVQPKKNNDFKNIKEENSNKLDTDMNTEVMNTEVKIDINNDISVCKNNIMKQYILNPLTVIIKLSVLSCKPIGTKIHIQDNIIYFNEPGIFQSLARYIFNSNKSHLQYLYNPIKIACQKYLTKEFIKTMPNIVNIFISAKNGIENLIKTYTSCSITVLCLKYYHVIITNYIKQTSNEYLFTESGFGFNEVDTKDFYTKALLDKFDNQWNTSKLKIVLDFMDFLLNHDINENKTNNIKSLETIINTNDEETQKIITNYNT